ncbi:hypothetical protein [Baekduia sp. Peel2402]|uniref:hypothetical protein n=1 Tax=Baekduia sp. Peel2402 TaxID=3458296 RepID=UPI00403E45CE
MLPSLSNQSFAATTFGASTEVGEPDLYNIFRTVWFRWTPSVSGGTYLAGCPADADIEVYTGSTIGTLDRVSGGGAKCGGDAKWVAKAGVAYKIRVNARTIAAGSAAMITLKQVTATPNAAMIETPAVTSRAGKLYFKETTGAEGAAIVDCDVDGKSQSCYVEGDHFVSALQSAFNLADGTHTFHVTLRDFYGNVDPTPLAYTWKVDATSPETTLVGQPDPLSGTPLLTFASNEPDSSFECRLDSSTWVACGSPWAMSVAFGSHIASVRAIDPVGNVDQTYASVNWTRKAPETPKAPVVPVVKPAPAKTPSATGLGSTPATGTTGTTGATGVQSGACYVTVSRPTTLTRRLLRNGIPVRVSAPRGCRWTVTLRRAGSNKALASVTGVGGVTKAARLKPSRRAAGKIAIRTRLELVAQGKGTPGSSRTVTALTVRS